MNVKKPRVKAPSSGTCKFIKSIIKNFHLNTVCESAACPNIAECWGKKHAAFMILGDTCTRSCAFCNVKNTGFTGKEFADMMLEKAGVACAPGSMFGKNCEDYVRFCYASSKENIVEAMDRMNNILRSKQ